MKRVIILLTCLILIFNITGCKEEVTVKKTIEGNRKTYSEMSDGSWTCGNYTYKNCLEISGRIPNAAVDTTFVYLSNLEEITFEQAWKDYGFSSNMNNYFSLEDAVLVDVRDE